MAKTDKADQVDLKSLARIGAATRLAELEREIAALKRVFPTLSGISVDVVDARVPHATAEKAARKAVTTGAKKRDGKKARRGRKTPMTATEKQAVSDRMKRFWARKHAEKLAHAGKQAEG